jgi:quercetin dioxygenase-like cupin family protein
MVSSLESGPRAGAALPAPWTRADKSDTTFFRHSIVLIDSLVLIVPSGPTTMHDHLTERHAAPACHRTRFAAPILLALLAVTAVSAQPFKFTPGPFEPELLEADQRIQSNFTGFVFNFANATKTDGGTPNGSLKSSQVQSNPFLTTLPGRGNGQTLVTMGPCAGNTPHTHPRGSEISFMVSGEVDFGMVEENAGDNALHLRRIKAGETIHIPQAIMHFSHNPHCFPAQFLANFGERDPGASSDAPCLSPAAVCCKPAPVQSAWPAMIRASSTATASCCCNNAQSCDAHPLSDIVTRCMC